MQTMTKAVIRCRTNNNLGKISYIIFAYFIAIIKLKYYVGEVSNKGR